MLNPFHVFSWWFSGACWPWPAFITAATGAQVGFTLIIWSIRGEILDDIKRDNWEFVRPLIISALMIGAVMLVWPLVLYLLIVSSPTIGILLWAKREAMLKDIIDRVSGDKETKV